MKMKKLFVIFCLSGIMFLNCASTGKTENVGQDVEQNPNPNPEIFGELYVEENAGFSMYIPRGWETVNFNQKYLMVRGPSEDGFAPNIGFGDEEYAGSIPEYIDAALGYLAQVYADLDVFQRDTFVTDAGLEGWFITLHGRINEIEVRQKMYVLANRGKTAIMVITGTASSTSGTKYDSLFDECVKTFNWTK